MTTLRSWRDGRGPRPITHLALTTFPHNHPSWILWDQRDDWYLYRTTAKPDRARETAPQIPQGPVGVCAVADVATYRRVLEIASAVPLPDNYLSLDDEDRMDADADHRDHVHSALMNAQPELPWDIVDAYVACPRLAHNFHAIAAPITLAADAAGEAAIMHLRSDHVYASVREEHGRWVIETGTGGLLQHHGACDTQAEAVALAQAIRDRAWITRVEEIRAARGGMLDWGAPIPLPPPVEIWSGTDMERSRVGACAVCGEPVGRDRAIVARSRGSEARYCSVTCRETAAKRRQRAKGRAESAS